MEKYKGLKKIGADKYIKPIQTITEKLSQEEIAKLLENYKETKINELKRGLHTRYFKKNKDGDLEFKLGGTLLKIDKDFKYVILMEKGITWSVQGTSIFYQQMTQNDKVEELETIIEKNDSSINELLSYIKLLEKTIKNKDIEIQELKNKYNKLKSDK